MNVNQIKAKNLIDGLLQQAETDPDYKAWREAHPEPDPKLQGMTREEKINSLIDKLMKLAEKEQQNKHEQLKNLLGHQNTASKDCTEIIKYINTEQSTGHYGEGNECLLYLDAFNYGYIQGKRAERARRRGELKQNTSL